MSILHVNPLLGGVAISCKISMIKGVGYTMIKLRQTWASDGQTKAVSK